MRVIKKWIQYWKLRMVSRLSCVLVWFSNYQNKMLLCREKLKVVSCRYWIYCWKYTYSSRSFEVFHALFRRINANSPLVRIFRTCNEVQIFDVLHWANIKKYFNLSFFFSGIICCKSSHWFFCFYSCQINEQLKK